MRRLVMLAGLVVAQAVLAGVPGGLGYSGRLLKASGAPETGLVTMGFSVFDRPTGGVALWSEQQQFVLSSDGLYATTLGGISPLPDSLFDGASADRRYLEVSVNGAPLLPRQPIDAVPWALTARSVKGGTADVTSLKLNGQEVLVNGRLAPALGYQAGAGISIDATNTISLPTCGVGEVLVWNASTRWTCGTSAGPPGQSVSSFAEPAGANCATGGTRLVSASGTTYVCSGAAGAAGATGTAGPQGAVGPQGLAGPPGVAGVSVTGSSEPPGVNCPAGGTRLVSASGTHFVCNGAAGAPGAPGSGLTKSVVTAATAASANGWYLVNSTSSVPVTLPADCEVGDQVRVTGINSGGFTVNAQLGDTLLSTSGFSSVSAVALAARSTCDFLCAATDTTWQLLSTGECGVNVSWDGVQSRFTGGNAAFYDWVSNSFSVNRTFAGNYFVSMWNPGDSLAGVFEVSFVLTGPTGSGGLSFPVFGLMTANQLATFTSSSGVHNEGVFGLYLIPGGVGAYMNGTLVATLSGINAGSTVRVRRNAAGQFEVYAGSSLLHTTNALNSERLYVGFGAAFNSASVVPRYVALSSISVTATQP